MNLREKSAFQDYLLELFNAGEYSLNHIASTLFQYCKDLEEKMEELEKELSKKAEYPEGAC
jgi:hypothetical protein